MFDQHDEKYLLGAMADNRVILFLGAGFSWGAFNKLGNNLPNGSALAEEIWKFLDYDSEYNGMDLGMLYSNLLKSGKSHGEIATFMEEQLMCDHIPESYNIMTKIFWRRIYTLNVDDLVENVYKRNGSPYLDYITYPNDDPKDRDQLLSTIQLVHLNGKLPCHPEDMTFSPVQYAKRAVLDTELYRLFVREYATFPTIFIGTSLDEPLLYQCIQERSSRMQNAHEERKKSFLISPDIDQAKKDYLFNTFNIIGVDAKTDDFLRWLEDKQGEFPDRIKIITKKYPDAARAISADPSNSKDAVIEFFKYFHRVPESIPRHSGSLQYLLGTTPSWEDILHNLDAPRNITEELISYIDKQLRESDDLSIIALLGYAGCGKSTILRRLGISLTQEGKSIFLTNSEELPGIEIFTKALDSFDDRTILLFDNAEAALGYLPTLARSMSQLEKKPIIILASRVNDFDRRSRLFDSSIDIKERHVPDLARNEIVKIIELLESKGLLGKLQGMNNHQRLQEFEKHARKQILVAMREATSGKGFDEIIEDEFRSLTPEEAHTLYLCAALSTEAGFRLTEQELLACSRLTPAETLHIIRRNLNNIIVRSGPEQNLLMIRHRMIADYIITSVASSKQLQVAYSKLLLAIQVGERESRTEKLFRRLTNHSIIYKRFEENIDEARKIYASLGAKFNRNPHYWLQYGNLEMTNGSLELADTYLHSAMSLDPNNFIIQNAIGHLKLKQSIVSNNKREAIVLRDEGSKILKEKFEWIFISSATYYDDPFPLHMYCSERFRWIDKWADSLEERKEELEHLIEVIKEGNRVYPRNSHIQRLRSEIERAYYSLAI